MLGSTPDEPFVFDNEKWAHPVEVRPFAIARAPVTQAEFAAFVEDGGYRQERAAELASRFPGEITLVELGSGSAAKTRLLMEAFLGRHGSLRYVPVDISRPMLEESSRALLEDYPALEILAVAGEYHDGLRHLKAEADRPKLILWLGSNAGNLERPEAAGFLSLVREAMSPGDRLLVGIDLRSDLE